MSVRIESFEPVVDASCRILILGTMPGIESLRRQEYYGHPQNAFWRIMGDVLGFDAKMDYSKRLQHVLERQVALWDVIASCERETSADSKIKNAAPNAIGDLIATYSNIGHIYFNGRKAEQFFMKHIAPTIEGDVRYTYLPSTSPANARLRYDAKREIWAEALSEF